MAAQSPFFMTRHGGESMSQRTWEAQLGARVPRDVASQISAYETDLELRRLGQLDERLFNEARLRRGVYGQRYDNGQRHDGARTRVLKYPSDAFKGPSTLWDAPGMQRIKIPFGAVTVEQMEVLADLAEEYSGGIVHVTTRQDFQLHFVHIDDTPDIMRRLAAVGITTLEACGNVVRNVTTCPLAGVCRDEPFDVTAHARALAAFLLGHPDAQAFGRKFKVAFSGCKAAACGVTSFHDLGFIARTREVNGTVRRGFELWVGGGLGPVPRRAELFDPFLPAEEVLPVAQAVCRVFARLGEKKNRARARLKFLLAKLGIDEFRRLVMGEWRTLPVDARWTNHLRSGTRRQTIEPPPGSAQDPFTLGPAQDRPLRPASSAGAKIAARGDRPGFEAWERTNVYPQRQEGYVTAAVTLPLGDLSAQQMQGLAALARTYTGDTVRTTVEQNIVFRWLAAADVHDFYGGLERIGLAEPGASSIVDVTACPGTDTCKLGIASSRGLAGELRRQLAEQDALADSAVKGLHIKVSGCFNSCGQHHVADLGFYGVSRKVEGRTVPHFQVVLGGQWEENASSFGLSIGAVPAKRIPEVVARLTDRYRRDGLAQEPFREFVQRTGKGALRAALQDLMEVPDYEDDPSLYSDWGDSRVFSVADIGAGECAGEVVTRFDFHIAASERQAFEAQVLLDQGREREAARGAFRAMLLAADALLGFVGAGAKGPAATDAELDAAAERIVEAFRGRFFESKLFFDPYAGPKFANYLFALHEEGPEELRAGAARAHVEEAQLFIEAAHACHARLIESGRSPAAHQRTR
jgi:sulfite reductase (ferredoxin)